MIFPCPCNLECYWITTCTVKRVGLNKEGVFFNIVLQRDLPVRFKNSIRTVIRVIRQVFNNIGPKLVNEIAN